MIPIANSRSQISELTEREVLPLSLLNDFLYCPRRAALKLLEGWREANEHTLRGELVHEHTDLPGYEAASSNLKSEIIWWRALPVWSERLGLSGKCDIVEVELHPAASRKARIPEAAAPRAAHLKSEISNLKFSEAWTGISDLTSGRIAALRPVEFKLGKRRRFENDDAQLCAQALCLEEMFGLPVPRGAIFHADSKRRREVEFTPDLRARTEQAVKELHDLFGQSPICNLQSEIPRLPPALWRPACQECSLFDLCLPKATARDGRSERLAASLFQI